MLLSLDTSTLTLSLALLEGERVLEHVVHGPPKRQSELLPQEIDTLLTRHRVRLADLEGFIVGLGPGSFTGLRIGVATVKGFAYALDKPVVGVSSLAAIALDGPEDLELFTSAVVKKGELYLGRYRRDGGRVTLLAPETSLTVPQFAEAMITTPEAVMTGPAVAEYRAQLERLGVPSTRFLDEPAFPSAIALARLGSLPAVWRKEDLFALEPHYLRGSGAEENPKFPPLPGVEPRARLKDE